MGLFDNFKKAEVRASANDFMPPFALGIGLSNTKPKSANSAKNRPRSANG